MSTTWLEQCDCGHLMTKGRPCSDCGRLFCHQCLDLSGLCHTCSGRDWNERGLGPDRDDEED